MLFDRPTNILSYCIRKVLTALLRSIGGKAVKNLSSFLSLKRTLVFFFGFLEPFSGL